MVSPEVELNTISVSDLFDQLFAISISYLAKISSPSLSKTYPPEVVPAVTCTFMVYLKHNEYQNKIGTLDVLTFPMQGRPEQAGQSPKRY